VRAAAKKKKPERKIFLTPLKLDPCWIKVGMTRVDEVGAYCGLFFLGDVHDRLVRDVAERVGGW